MKILCVSLSENFHKSIVDKLPCEYKVNFVKNISDYACVKDYDGIILDVDSLKDKAFSIAFSLFQECGDSVFRFAYCSLNIDFKDSKFNSISKTYADLVNALIEVKVDREECSDKQ